MLPLLLVYYWVEYMKIYFGKTFVALVFKKLVLTNYIMFEQVEDRRFLRHQIASYRQGYRCLRS